jgi:hypothetical protein
VITTDPVAAGPETWHAGKRTIPDVARFGFWILRKRDTIVWHGARGILYAAIHERTLEGGLVLLGVEQAEALMAARPSLWGETLARKAAER